MNPWRALLAKRRRRPLRVFHDEAYRLPLSGVEAAAAPMETRRADDALHYLLHEHAIGLHDVTAPAVISYEALSRVHTSEYLESLMRPETLALCRWSRCARCAWPAGAPSAPRVPR